MTRFADLLRSLFEGGVDFIVVGGVAATVHGSPRSTFDLDVAYSRRQTNLRKLVDALGPHRPYLRGAPPGLPFRFDVETLKSGLNFTLTTDLGAIDLLGEIAGGGNYDQLLAHSVDIDAYGLPLKVLDLDTLIHTRRAAGRPKDFESIAELELLRDRTKSRPA